MLDIELFKKLIKEAITKINRGENPLAPPPNTDVVLDIKSVTLTAELHKPKCN